MADNDSTKEVIAAAGLNATEETLSIAKKILDTHEKIRNASKEHNALVTDLVQLYKRAVIHSGENKIALKEINGLILSDLKLRERLEDNLVDSISERQLAVNSASVNNIKNIVAEQEAKQEQEDAEKKHLKDTKAISEGFWSKNIKFLGDKKRISKMNQLQDKLAMVEENKRTIEQKEQLKKLEEFRNLSDTEKKKRLNEFSKDVTDAGQKQIDNIKIANAESVNAAAQAKKDSADALKKPLDELRLEQGILATLRAKPQLTKAFAENATGALSSLGGIAKFSAETVVSFRDMKNPLTLLNIATSTLAFTMKMLSKMVASAVDRFKELEDTAEKFRKETGLTIYQSKDLTNYIDEMSVKYGYLGLSAEEYTKTTKALVDLYGDINMVSKDTVKDITLMAVNLGVAQEDSAAILSTFVGLNKMSEKTAMNIMKGAAGLFRTNKDAGIPFSKVMHDVANASDDVLTSIGSSPVKLMRASVAARALGLELNKVGSQQKRLLDYTGSITDELEASALLGRNITFMKARQLAFEGKSKESMEETLDVVKRMGDFNAMTPYQRAAVAKAAGMELKDLTKALAVDKARADILNGSDTKAIQRLRAQDALLKGLEKESDLTSEKLLQQGDEAANERQILGLMTSANNALKSMAVIFSQAFGPAIEQAAKFFGWIASILSGLDDGGKALLSWGAALTGIVVTIASVGFAVSKIRSTIAATKDALKGMQAAISNTSSAATSLSETAAELKHITPTATRTDSRVLHKISGPVSDLAKTEAALPPAGPSGPGSKFAMLMKNINAGITAISMQAIGKFALISVIFIASLVGIAYAVKQFQGVDWKTLGVAMVAIGGFMTAAILLGKTVLAGAEGIVAFELALFGLGIALLPVSLAFTVTANAINIAKDSLVQILEKAEPSKILAFGAAFTTMTFALAAAAPFAASAGAGLLIMTAGLLAFGLAMQVMGNSADKFGKGMTLGVNALQSLATINFISLFANVNKLGTQLKSSTGMFKEFVAGVFGNDTITKVEKLSKMSQDITPTAAAIATMVASFQEFNVVNSFANAIDKLATSFVSLNTAVAALDTNKLIEVRNSVGTATNVPATTTSTQSTNTDTTKIEEVLTRKLGEFVKAIEGMTIQMDGNVIGKAAVKAGARSGTTN